MGALNSLDCLNFGVLVRGIFPMLLFQSTYGGAQGGGMGHTSLFSLPPTALLLMVKTGLLLVPIRGSIRGSNTGISSYRIPIIRLLNKLW